jgi:hypothetical protein
MTTKHEGLSRLTRLSGLPWLGALALTCTMGTAHAQTQTQDQTVLTNFQPTQQWLQVATDTVATLGAMPAGSFWSSPQVNPLTPTLSLADVGGNQFLWLEGGQSVRYTFTGLVIGTTYDVNLSFLYAAYRFNQGDTDTTQPALRITSDVLPQRTRAENMSTGCSTATVGCTSFYQAALTREVVTWGTSLFTATATSAYIDFAALGNDRSRVAIDNVRTTITPISPVPEPQTWALMLAGLGAIGSLARRRRKASS